MLLGTGRYQVGRDGCSRHGMLLEIGCCQVGSDSRWHGRDLGMWDKASHRTFEEQAESEPAIADSVLSDSALPDSENDTVYLTLPRKAG